jgi:hypothetical protein
MVPNLRTGGLGNNSPYLRSSFLPLAKGSRGGGTKKVGQHPSITFATDNLLPACGPTKGCGGARTYTSNAGGGGEDAYRGVGVR